MTRDIGHDDTTGGEARGSETPDHLPGAEATRLDGVERARWQAATSAMKALGESLRAGKADEEGVRATLEQIHTIPIDHDRILNALHVPERAGSLEPALEEILRRIPDGWGRWISCDAGWYPLVVRTHEQLKALDDGYIVQQIKEKFGSLRFYAQPGQGAEAPEGLADAMNAVATDAEQASRTICEWCGERGEVREVREVRHWYKTLCGRCFEEWRHR